MLRISQWAVASERFSVLERHGKNIGVRFMYSAYSCG